MMRRVREEHDDISEFVAQQDENNKSSLTLKIGIYGWRKRCLYFFLLLLLVIIAINLALTIWILVVLDFNSKGIDKLEITDDGIRLEGVAEFRETVRARDISAIEGSNLTVTSSRQVQMVAGTSTVVLRNDDIVIETNNFQIRSPDRDSPLVAVTDGVLTVNADILEATGTRGISLDGPIEANTIRAHNKQQLSIESASGRMNILGSQGVAVQATAGEVYIHSFEELLLSSSNGPVIIDATDVRIQLPASGDTVQPLQDIYEVCICRNSGRMFLAVANGTNNCASQQDMCT